MKERMYVRYNTTAGTAGASQLMTAKEAHIHNNGYRESEDPRRWIPEDGDNPWKSVTRRAAG